VAFVVPGLTETADKGFFEELIEGKLEAFAEFEGRAADIPFVVVEGWHAGYGGDANGVEGTGDGFLPTEFAGTIGGVDSTEGTTGTAGLASIRGDIGITDEDAVFAVDYGGDEVTIAIGIDYTVLFYFFTCLGRQVRPDNIFGMFEFDDFVKGYRGTCVAFDTTDAMTAGQVTAEVHLKDVKGNKGILNLYQGTCTGYWL